MTTRPDGARRRRRLSNLQLRALSGVVLALVAAAETWLGGVWFELFAVAIGVVVFAEWCVITRARADSRHQVMSAALFALVLLLSFAKVLPPLVALGAGLVLCWLAGLARGRWHWTLLGFLYAGLSALSLAAIRGDTQSGLLAVVVLFAIVWTTDTMAYFTGRALRGPKLAPKISPGKTWSGAAGGALFGTAAGVGAAAWSGAAGLWAVALLAMALSVVSQGGDLFESWIKRRFGMKDSGRIIPGHGGVMDRVDGLVAASAVLYLAGLWLAPGGEPVGWLLAGRGL